MAQKIRIFVRRGGPNYQEGLKSMKALGAQLGITMHVYGPETHMTAIGNFVSPFLPLPFTYTYHSGHGVG